jgi:biopolymer transport protein ExbB
MRVYLPWQKPHSSQPYDRRRASMTAYLSPWGMFENSDLVVKAVIIGLAFASLVTWTVWLAKTLELRSARAAVRRDLRVLNNSVTLAQAHDQLREGDSPVSQLMRAAGQEIRLSANLRADGLKERIALQLERIEMAVSRRVSRGTGVLATIGSTAPFVGLFGTVWGSANLQKQMGLIAWRGKRKAQATT